MISYWNKFALSCCVFFWAAALVLIPSSVQGEEPSGAPTDPPSVAVLPLANYSGDATAIDVFTPLIARQLENLGINVIEPGLTRQTLRRYRIRAVGTIDRAGAMALAGDLGAGYLVTGSIDLFVTGDVPEVGVSLRLVDAQSQRVVWARSTGAAATDYGTVFGLGEVTTNAGLAERVINEALKDLDRDMTQGFAWELPGSAEEERLAVIAFDDLVPASHGGRVVSAHVLSHLVNRGFFVIEPGVANEFFLLYQRIPRGGIDYVLLSALHDSLGVSSVITGMVDPFQLGSPGSAASFPTVGINARIIDATSGRILKDAEVSRAGDREIIFGIGSTRSGARLIRAATGALLDKLQLKENSSVALQ